MKIKSILKVSHMAYLFLFSHYCFSQAHYSPAWKSTSYSQIFSLDFIPNNPKPSLIPEESYLTSYRLTIKNLIVEEPSTQAVQEQIEKSSLLIENSNLPPQYKQYYLNDLLLFGALMELKAGSEVKFMWMMNQLYRKARDLTRQYPDFLAANKIYALMQILVGSVPEQYEWIFNLLGFEGNTEKGMALLKHLSTGNLPLNEESNALYFLVGNYLQPELSGSGLQKIDSLIAEKPHYDILKLIAALSYLKQHKSEGAQHYLNALHQQYNIPIVSYFLAETYLYEGKYKMAELLFLDYISRSKTTNLKKDSYFKIYLIKYITGEPLPIQQQYKTLALAQQGNKAEADKNAEKLLNTTPLPHPDIFRLRFFTDGGLLDEALDIIQQADIESFSPKDENEFVYRRARAYHHSGKIKEAINDYKVVLKNDDGRYFAPNSALQLGYIYEGKNDVNAAEKFFQLVFTFDGYTYENSIKGKAKSALKNLKN